MRTDLKMKVFEWQKERLSVPVALVLGTSFCSQAQKAIDEANSVEYALGRAIKQLYPREGKGNKKAFDTIISNACRDYWHTLRPSYDDMLRDMASAAPFDLETARHEIAAVWRGKVKSAALGTFRRWATDLDANSEAIRKLVTAERNLIWSVNSILATPEEREARQNRSARRGKPQHATTEGGP